MEPRRIVQLALGVPDTIHPDRRDEAATILLAKKAEQSNEYLQEAADLCRPIYDVLVEAVGAGELDGWLAGWDDNGTTALRGLKRIVDQDPSTQEGSFEARFRIVEAGAKAIVAWSAEHPMLDPDG